MKNEHTTRSATSADNRTTVLRFLHVAHALERRLDGQLSMTRGISFREYQILSTIAQAPQGSVMRVDLASAIGLTPSAVTRALRPLEKLGTVRTESDPRDARRSLAALTKAGRKLLADAEGAFTAVVDDLELSEDDARALVELMDTLSAGMARRSTRSAAC